MININQINAAPTISIILALLATLSVRIFFKRGRKVVLAEAKTAEKQELAAYYDPYRAVPLFFIVVLLLTFSLWQIFIVYQGYDFSFKVFYLAFAAVLIAQMALSLLAKPFKGAEKTKKSKVAVIVPAYNEDHESFKHCLDSILDQTLTPTEVHVVDDGSKDSYAKIKKDFLEGAKKMGIIATWTKQKNMGKRKAHATAIGHIKNHKDSIVVTIDSDGTLDLRALEEGLKPFSDPKVMSVAGLAVSKTVDRSWISKLTDLFFVGFFQLIDRTAMSQLGSVMVNTGSLAFYRMEVIIDALANDYTNETFMGKTVTISDDSFLTFFSLLRGKAVQQPSSIVFADMPVTFDHHVRQQMRWMRGSFIRTLWRLKYLPVLSWAYIRQLIGWLMLASTTTILVIFFIYRPLVEQKTPPLALFLVGIIIGYMQAARYLSIVRNDLSRTSQFVSFILAPLAILYSTIVLRAFRFWGMLTPYKNDWGTRESVEATTNRK